MPSLNMTGPCQLMAGEVNNVVVNTSPGNYALGYTKDNGIFVVEYVGRSDDDVNGRLHHWVSSKYKEFKYSYASSAKSAFEKECRNYHDFGGNQKLDNEIHPDRPVNSNWQCPVCEIFD